MLLAPVPVQPAQTIAERVAAFRAYCSSYQVQEAIKHRGEHNVLRDWLKSDSATLDAVETELYAQRNAEALRARREQIAKARGLKTEPRCGFCDQPFRAWDEAWRHEQTAHATEATRYAREHSAGGVKER